MEPTNIVVSSGRPVDPSATNKLVIPPLPPGVAELKFTDFFKPIGPRGLEYTDKVRALAGKKVRLLGYMARQPEPKPGLFLFTPVPLQMNEHEYGLAEDMPATLIHVFPTVERWRWFPRWRCFPHRGNQRHRSVHAGPVVADRHAGDRPA